MSEAWYYPRNGLSERVLIAQFEKQSGLAIDHQAAIATMRANFLSSITGLCSIELVAEIARAAKGDVPLAVASGGPRAIVVPSLEQTSLAPLFDAIVTLDDVPVPKPAPDLFLEAASRLRVEPSACLVFEDSDTGVAAALAAGMGCIDVRNVALVQRVQSLAPWRS